MRQGIKTHRRKKENVSHGIVSAEVLTREFRGSQAAAGAWGDGSRGLAEVVEVNANVLHRWRREMRDDAGQAFADAGRRNHQQESDVVELEPSGRQAIEIDFLRRCLQRVEEQRKLQALSMRSSSTPSSSKK